VRPIALVLAAGLALGLLAAQPAAARSAAPAPAKGTVSEETVHDVAASSGAWSARVSRSPTPRPRSRTR
jgi:hypothetical protein